MLPALSQVCCLAAPFEDDIDGFADAAGGAIELWLNKLETYLQTHTVADVRKLAADRDQKFVAASYQGGLLLSQGDARHETWSQFEQRLDLLAELQVPTLVVVADFLGPFSQTDIERAQVSLRQAGEMARSRGVRLAVEFQSKSTFVNNLETAVSLVQSVEQSNVGICLDVFHYYTGPSKFEDLRYLTAENLFHVQVCDLADRPRELATDGERILPGDGDFQLQPIVQHLREIGYPGYVSLEVLNPQFWSIPPRQVGEIGLTALRILLGQHSGGTAGMLSPGK